MRAASFLLAWAFVATAQNPPADILDSYRPPLLTFTVVALDSSGAPLRGLQAAGLRIYDDGQLMHAAFCRPLERQFAPLGQREYSNRPTGADSRNTLILLDLLNADLAERSLGWTDIVRTFRKLELGERLYVYLLTNEGVLYPIHRLPDPASAIPADDTEWAAQLPSLLDQAMRKVSHLRPQDLRLDVDARVRTTFAVLGNLAAYFGAQPGRKSLVWISHGVPIGANGPDGQWRDYTPLVTRFGADLARAGIVVYAVDQEERTTSGIGSTDTLQQVAGLTAGKWFTGATEQAIRQAVSEGPATYQVGYVPLPGRWDNKFHKLRLSTEDKGVRLRATTGYYGDVREVDPRQRFALAALGQCDDSGIGIRAAVTSSRTENGWDQLEVRVDAADLQLTPGDTYTGEFSLTLAFYDSEWQCDTSKSLRTQLRLTPAERDSVIRDGLSMSFDRPVPTGVHRIRIVVRDHRSGAVGSLTVPLASL